MVDEGVQECGSGTSPAVNGESCPMTWCEAQQALLDGKRIARKSWGTGDFIFLYRGILTIQSPRGILANLAVQDGDMVGTDWTVVA